MPDFQFKVGPRVWIGNDALLRLPLLASEIAGADRARVMLVADPILHESKLVDRVRSLLEDRNIQVLLFDEIPDRATSRAADDALRLARGSRSPLIVAIGGIKTLMIARAAAAAAPSTNDIDELLDGAESRARPLPLIEIPTTLRHPFMFDDCILLSDGRDRRVRMARVAGSAPYAVLIDHGLSGGLSAKLTASCVIDGLLGAVEAYVSSRSSF
ncbi:MAG TPA: iron-containing alcohol dehydrogenase, partial [Rectinemataceae bacterium]|nr:iron-containing alcohol dehydrogenase [Rectinemataceae bacterium]